MATVRLSDVIVPEVFNAYMLVETMVKAGVFRSGIVAANADLSAKLAAGGTTFQTPVWTDLADTGSSVATDNPADVITPDKMTAFKMQSRRMFRTKAWAAMDLVSELAGDKPMQRIVSRVSEWWARDFNAQAIAVLNGVINANIANNSADMVYSCGVGVSGSAPTAGLNAVSILEAKQTMGERADMLRTLMVHSRTYTNLQEQNLITFIPNARGEVSIPTYLGYELVVVDTLPVTAIPSSSDYSYTSYLSAPGILAFGESAPAVPVETFRQPWVGMGSGDETLYTRRQFSFHPLGHNWKEASVAGSFPTNAELATAGNWERKFPERKQVPFVAIRSKNG